MVEDSSAARDKLADRMRQVDRLTVRFTSALRRELREAARRRGMRESDYVREAVEVKLSSEEPVFTAGDLARRAGLVGILKDAPPDLSTNQAHLEGLGKS
jgi:predicted DNA-binding protein